MLDVEGYVEKVNVWWNSFGITGTPDHVPSKKLQLLKGRLRKWNKSNYGSLENIKNELLAQVAQLDSALQNDNSGVRIVGPG